MKYFSMRSWEQERHEFFPIDMSIWRSIVYVQTKVRLAYRSS